MIGGGCICVPDTYTEASGDSGTLLVFAGGDFGLGGGALNRALEGPIFGLHLSPAGLQNPQQLFMVGPAPAAASAIMHSIAAWRSARRSTGSPDHLITRPVSSLTRSATSN